MKVYFYFGRKEDYDAHNIVLGSTPLVISHKDLEDLGLNYQTLHKIFERPEDGTRRK